jgi:hypothetical protein
MLEQRAGGILGAQTKMFRSLDFQMPLENPAQSGKFVGPKGGCFHPELFAAWNPYYCRG